jgi:hypothetical protein
MGRPNKRGDVEKYHCKEGQTLKDLLISLHHGQKLSISEIAERLYVPAEPEKELEEIKLGKSTVYHWLEYFDIPSRENIPSSVLASIEKTVTQNPNKNTEKTATFDPRVEGFRCQPQCPYFDICKYREHCENRLCPISNEKKKQVINPIKAIIAERYQDNPMLLQHYNNIADLTASTWELLNRKMSYIQSEDVTQLLNRPDPMSGELKLVKVANLLNSEISKDQTTLIKLLELLKVTPKTADEKEDEDIFVKMASEVIKAKQDRNDKQDDINKEKELKNSRAEIRSEKDFNSVMKELESRRNIQQPSEEEVDGAQSIEDMFDDR